MIEFLLHELRSIHDQTLVDTAEFETACAQCFACLHDVAILGVSKHRGATPTPLNKDSAARFFSFLLPLLQQRDGRQQLLELQAGLEAVMNVFDCAPEGSFRC